MLGNKWKVYQDENLGERWYPHQVFDPLKVLNVDSIIIVNCRVRFGNTFSCRIRPAQKISDEDIIREIDKQILIKCFRSGSVLGTNFLTSSQVHTSEATIISTLTNITSMSFDGNILTILPKDNEDLKPLVLHRIAQQNH